MLNQIRLVRHAQSKLNAGLVTHMEQPNHSIPITDLGVEQAQARGKSIGHDAIINSIRYCSPYTRTVQTMHNILIGAGVSPDIKIYEDARLRESDFGYQDPVLQKPIRNVEGYFWYRYDGGESPADCEDRADMFLGSMWRQVERTANRAKTMQEANPSVLIVTHGIMIKTFVKRFMHLTVKDFEAIDNPNNCDVITIARKETLENPQYTCGKWGVTGLLMR